MVQCVFLRRFAGFVAHSAQSMAVASLGSGAWEGSGPPQLTPSGGVTP